MIRFFLAQIFFYILLLINIQLPVYAADRFCHIEDEKLRISEETLGIALLIGNNAYKSTTLKHPINDAIDIGKLLKKFKFSVALIKNISNRQKFRIIIDNFINCLRIDTNLVAFFYFSGYGKYVEIQGEKNINNYLLPTNDSNINDIYDITDDGYSVQTLFLKLGEKLPENRKIFVLDACRNYPKFEIGDGLAEMKVEYIDNYFISFPTLISKIDDDDERIKSETIKSDPWKTRNSLYVKHLLKKLEDVKKADGAVRIERVFDEIKDSMEEDERNKFERGNLKQKAFFFPTAAVLSPPFCFDKKCKTQDVCPASGCKEENDTSTQKGEGSTENENKRYPRQFTMPPGH